MGRFVARLVGVVMLLVECSFVSSVISIHGSKGNEPALAVFIVLVLLTATCFSVD